MKTKTISNNLCLKLFCLVSCSILLIHNSNSQGHELTKEEQEYIKNSREKSIFPLPDGVRQKKVTTEEESGTNLKTRSGATRPLRRDSDNDGLTDQEETILGTKVFNKDTDMDGLWDGWETNITNGIDLRELGASPLHKDIFVQMDYMVRGTATNGLGPNSNVIRRIEQAFASAPVMNPDGTTGINIHLITGNEIPYDEDLNPFISEFYNIKENNFIKEKAPFFHYMIWANSYDGTTSSGQSVDIPEADFAVTLGTWNDGKGGTDDEKVGTFIHELGHNLGLKHGGSDHVKYKPNHVSVMNYLFQISGIKYIDPNNITTYLYSYQRWNLPTINEKRLVEEDGLGKNDSFRGFHTAFRISAERIIDRQMDSSIDWDNNGSINVNSVEADLNIDGQKTDLKATENEWLKLHFTGGAIGKLGDFDGILDAARQNARPSSEPELTREQSEFLKRR